MKGELVILFNLSRLKYSFSEFIELNIKKFILYDILITEGAY